MTIGEDGIHVDYAGTSPASASGINVVLNYTTAYTAFGVKCVVAPEVPNNAGSVAPMTVSAPEGCLLNAKRPRAVAARHTVGHMLPAVVFGCLHQVIEGGGPAEGASSLWIPQIYGGADVLDELGAEDGRWPPDIKPFTTAIFHSGGPRAPPGPAHERGGAAGAGPACGPDGGGAARWPARPSACRRGWLSMSPRGCSHGRGLWAIVAPPLPLKGGWAAPPRRGCAQPSWTAWAR